MVGTFVSTIILSLELLNARYAMSWETACSFSPDVFFAPEMIATDEMAAIENCGSKYLKPLLKKVAAENMDLVMSHHRNANCEVLEKSIRMANVMASYLERSIQDLSGQALIAVGKLMGCIETLEKLQYENDQTRDQFLNSKRLVKQNNMYNWHQILRYFTLKHPYI